MIDLALFVYYCFLSDSAESLLIYDLKTMQLALDLSDSSPIPRGEELTSCFFNHNSQLVISAGKDGKVRIFDIRKRDCLSSWNVGNGGQSPVVSGRLSADETTIYCLTADGVFSGWSLVQTGQRVFSHLVEDQGIQPEVAEQNAVDRVWTRQFSLSGDGTHVLTCSSNGGTIYEFSSSEMAKVLGLKGLRGRATCTDWSSVSDCGPCLTAGTEGQIIVSTLLSQ